MYTSFERSVNARKQLRGKDGRWIYEGGTVKWWDAVKGLFRSGTVTGFSGDYVDVQIKDGPTAKVHRTNITSVSKKASLPTSSGTSDSTPEPTAADEPENHGPKDISSWTKGKNLGGSNGAAIYTDEDGNEYAVKFPQSELHAKNEVLASRIYAMAGVNVPNQELIERDGKIGVASPMVPDVQGDLSTKLNDPDTLDKLQDGFAVDAWVANWDVAGLTFDNVVIDGNGDPVRVDLGGALIFRAQGSPKGDAFDSKAGEWDSLRTSDQGKKIFGSDKMSDEKAAESAKKVQAVSDENIDAVVGSVDMDSANADKIKNLLKERRKAILDKAGLTDEPAPKADLDFTDAADAPETEPEAFTPITDPDALKSHLDEVGIQNYIDNAKSGDKVVYSESKAQVGDVMWDAQEPGSPAGVIVGKHSIDGVTVRYPDGTEKKRSTHPAAVSVYRPNKAVTPQADSATEDSTNLFTVLPADQRGKSGDGYHSSGPWGKYGASGVAIKSDDTGKIFIVQRGGIVSSNKGKWQLPGGALEENETPYQAAAREVTEETSVTEDDLGNWTHKSDVVFDNGKGWKYTNIAATVPNEFEITVDPNESQDGKWVTPEELKDMANNGELVPAFASNVDNIIGAYGSDDDTSVDIPEPDAEELTDDEAEDTALPSPAQKTQGVGGKGNKGISTADNGQSGTKTDHTEVSLSGVPKGKMTKNVLDIQSANIGQKVYQPSENDGPDYEWTRLTSDTWQEKNSGMTYTSNEMQALAKADGMYWGSKEDYEAANPAPESEPEEEPKPTIPDTDKTYGWEDINDLLNEFSANANQDDDTDIATYNLNDGSTLLLTKNGGEDDGIEILPAGKDAKPENWLGPITWEDSERSSDPSELIEDLIFGGSANDPETQPRLSQDADDLDSLAPGDVVKFANAPDNKVYKKNDDGTWNATWLPEDHKQKNVTSDQIHAVAAYVGEDVQVVKESGADTENSSNTSDVPDWEKPFLPDANTPQNTEEENKEPETVPDTSTSAPANGWTDSTDQGWTDENLTEKLNELPVGTTILIDSGYGGPGYATKVTEHTWEDQDDGTKHSVDAIVDSTYASEITQYQLPEGARIPPTPKEERKKPESTPEPADDLTPTPDWTDENATDKLDELPAGTDLHIKAVGHPDMKFTKKDNGTWSDHFGSEWSSNSLSGSFYASEMTGYEVPDTGESSEDKDKKKEDLTNFLNEARPNSTIVFTKESGQSYTYNKQMYNGMWYNNEAGESWKSEDVAAAHSSDKQESFTPGAPPEPEPLGTISNPANSELLNELNLQHDDDLYDFIDTTKPGDELTFIDGDDPNNNITMVKQAEGSEDEWIDSEGDAWTDTQIAGTYGAWNISDYKGEATPENSEVAPDPSTNLLNQFMNMGDTPDIAKTVDGINYDSQGNAWVPDKGGKAIRPGDVVTAKAGEKGKIELIQKGGKKVRVKTEDGNTKFWNVHLVDKTDPSAFDDSNNKYAIQEDENGEKYLNTPDGDRVYVGDTVVSSGKTGFEGEVVDFKNGEFVLVKDPSDGKTKPRKIDKIKLVSSNKPQPAPTAEPQESETDTTTPVDKTGKVATVDDLAAAVPGDNIHFENQSPDKFFTKKDDGYWYYTKNGEESVVAFEDVDFKNSIENSQGTVWGKKEQEAPATTPTPEAPHPYTPGEQVGSPRNLDAAPAGTAVNYGIKEGTPTFVKTDTGSWDVYDAEGNKINNYKHAVVKAMAGSIPFEWTNSPAKNNPPKSVLDEFDEGDSINGITQHEVAQLPEGTLLRRSTFTSFKKVSPNTWQRVDNSGNPTTSNTVDDEEIYDLASEDKLTKVSSKSTQSDVSAPKPGDKVVSVDQMDAMPEGYVISYKNGTASAEYTKNSEGTWTDDNGMKIASKYFSGTVKNEYLFHGPSAENSNNSDSSSEDKYAPGTKITDISQLDEMKPGDVIGSYYSEGAEDHSAYKKNENGMWNFVSHDGEVGTDDYQPQQFDLPVTSGKVKVVSLNSQKTPEPVQETTPTASTSEPSIVGKNGKNISKDAIVSYTTPQKSKKGKVVSVDPNTGDVVFVDDATGKKAKHKGKFLTVEEEASSTPATAGNSGGVVELSKDPNSPWYDKPEPVAPDKPSNLRTDFAIDGLLEEISENYKKEKGKDFKSSSYYNQWEQLSKNGSSAPTVSVNEAKYGTQKDLFDFFAKRGYISQETADKARKHYDEVKDHNSGIQNEYNTKQSKYSNDLMEWKVANGVPLGGFVSTTYKKSDNSQDILNLAPVPGIGYGSEADASNKHGDDTLPAFTDINMTPKDKKMFKIWVGGGSHDDPDNPDESIPYVSWQSFSVDLRTKGKAGHLDPTLLQTDHAKVKKAITEAIEKSTVQKDMLMTRSGDAMNFTGPNGESFSDWKDLKSMVGSVVSDYGVIAGSPGHKPGYDTRSMHIKIRVPAGAKAAWLGGKNKLNVGEREMLLPPGSKFLIHDVQPAGNGNSKPTVIVDLVPDNWTPAAGQTTQAVNKTEADTGGPTVTPTTPVAQTTGV